MPSRGLILLSKLLSGSFGAGGLAKAPVLLKSFFTVEVLPSIDLPAEFCLALPALYDESSDPIGLYCLTPRIDDPEELRSFLSKERMALMSEVI